MKKRCINLRTPVHSSVVEDGEQPCRREERKNSKRRVPAGAERAMVQQRICKLWQGGTSASRDLPHTLLSLPLSSLCYTASPPITTCSVIYFSLGLEFCEYSYPNPLDERRCSLEFESEVAVQSWFFSYQVHLYCSDCLYSGSHTQTH